MANTHLSEETYEELEAAFVLIESRLALLEAKATSISEAQWNSIDANLLALIPPWLKRLMSDFSVVGGVLEAPNYEKENDWNLYYILPAAPFFEERLRFILDDDVARELLLEKGLFPVAEETDSNFWVVDATSEGLPVYFYDRGGEQAILASRKLSFFLTSIAVSCATDFGTPYRVKPATIWPGTLTDKPGLWDVAG